MIDNKPLEIASEFIHHTNKNVFLTGKAGTGKTTFLHNLRKTLLKRMVIVAPTGVAAINAGGVTIHSFFQLPFGPFIPEHAQQNQRVHKFNKERINVIKGLELLVIDEISMVRADLLDAIDEVLRRYKDRNQPFGGVQLLMIGDLHQLAPVAQEAEWAILKEHYETIYFFGSHALRQSNPIRIELTHIYRQSDQIFIDLLNKIRDNRLDADSLKVLNQRYVPNFTPTDSEGYITLSTHNAKAQNINLSRLAHITSKTQYFTADIGGEFPQGAYPTELNLELKVGAQVMFVKNDNSRDRLYYNGKIGQIRNIDNQTITVWCKEDNLTVEVQRVEWTNVKYVLNEQTKELVEHNIGSFIQFPLKLAWAITIHKSQGLTFEKAIIDASSSFAHGQVYVALSRCKSLEGMVLSSPISTSSIKTDDQVSVYTKDAEQHKPDQLQLDQAKSGFYKFLLIELFDHQEIKSRMYHSIRLLQEHAEVINPSAYDTISICRQHAENDIFAVAEKFLNQIKDKENLEGDINLQARIQKGCIYFAEKVHTLLLTKLNEVVIETDNAAVKKTVVNALDHLRRAVFIKNACLLACSDTFSTSHYMKSKADADLDFKEKSSSTPAKKSTYKTTKDAPLYEELKRWRNKVAADHNVLDYMVIQMKTLLELTDKKPATLKELEKIKGIGKAKINQYGAEILEIINEYRSNNNIESEPEMQDTEPELTKEKKSETNTKELSLQLHKAGKSIYEIAQERNLTTNTIENHLLHFIGTPEIDIFALIDNHKIEKIIDQSLHTNVSSLTQLKDMLGDEISYWEIKSVLKHLKNNES